MPYLEKENFLLKLKEKLGDDTSDETLSLIEDASDTYDELTRKSEGQENWKAKYEENDRSWREKYRERFFTTPEDVKKDQLENVKDDSEKRSFEDLFEEREG